MSFIIQPSAAGGASVQAVARGNLPNGSPVVVNSDGTVTVVQLPIGSSAVFESAITQLISAVYDSVNQKIVIAYADLGNSSFGTCVVGTVSGTSISFGTPVAFTSTSIAVTGNAKTSIAYDSVNQKVIIGFGTLPDGIQAIVGTVSGTSVSFGTAVVVYAIAPNQAQPYALAYDAGTQKVVFAFCGLSNRGQAAVGTVSGTSISFGAIATFDTSSTEWMSIAYDTVNQKVVIAYSDLGTSGGGTAVVGTVSGTSISFGTGVIFETGNSDWIDVAYDSNSGKIVVAYSDVGNSDYGTAAVGTVSGTSISFGTPVVFESAQSLYIAISYDSNAQKSVISYRDNGNSGYGTVILGTVSGTSISFNNAYVFRSAAISHIASAYDANAQKIVILYSDVTTLYGTGIVFDALITPLAQNTFIGFSSSTYTNGQTATINVISNSIGGLSLSAGNAYYLTTSGTLTTTATNNVYAGIALNANTLLIKG